MNDKKNGKRAPAKPTTMKLAEALSLVADAKKRLAMATSRATASARYQDGEPPVESAGERLAEAQVIIGQMEDLVRRINHTNAATVHEGSTLTAMLARRDALGKKAKTLREVADAAAGQTGRLFYGRQLRSELTEKTDLDVPNLRHQADSLSETRRALDVTIQQLNWATDLLE